MKGFREFFYRKYRFGILESLNVKNDLLNEGLITSYPFNSLITKLVQKFGKNIYDISSSFFDEIKKTAGITFFCQKNFADDNFLEALNSILSVYGYFVAAKDVLETEIGFFIEPKYPFIIDTKKLKDKKCYHITNKKFLSKIQKFGLIPKKSQTDFTFEGNRIYLMIGNDDTVIRALGKQIAKNKIGWDENDLIVLEVLNFHNINLYFDMNFDTINGNFACFTYQNISPKFLKIYK